MKIKGVIFDLDGTLLDSLSDISSAMNTVLVRNGFPSHEECTYRYFVGDGAEELIRRSVPKEVSSDSAEISRLLSELGEEYARNLFVQTKPYEEIIEMLKILRSRGLKLGVLSNKMDRFAKQTVDYYFKDQQIDSVCGAREDFPKKPHPAGAFWVADQMGVEAEDCLFLGDTKTDMLTAQGAGMFGVGVLWGFRDAEELLLSGALYLIDTPLEILDLLE